MFAHLPISFVWLFLICACVLHVAVFIEEYDISFIKNIPLSVFARNSPMIAYHQPTHGAFYCQNKDFR